MLSCDQIYRQQAMKVNECKNMQMSSSTADEGEDDGADWYLNIEPFEHQVSGHNSVLMLGRHIICKSFNFREQSFYEKLPGVLRHFTPNYFGVIEVEWLTDESGRVRPVGRPFVVVPNANRVPTNVSGVTSAGSATDTRSHSTSRSDMQHIFCVTPPSETSESDGMLDTSHLQPCTKEMVVNQAAPHPLTMVTDIHNVQQSMPYNKNEREVYEQVQCACKRLSGASFNNKRSATTNGSHELSDSFDKSYKSVTKGINPWAIERYRIAVSRMSNTRLNSEHSDLDGVSTTAAVGQKMTWQSDTMLHRANSVRSSPAITIGTESEIVENSKRHELNQNLELLSPEDSTIQQNPGTDSITPIAANVQTVCTTLAAVQISQIDGASDELSQPELSNACSYSQNRLIDREKYVLLENLTAYFSKPSIIDLKMGTRHHGDDAPESKVRSISMKCRLSTSATLGLRIGGMQSYHADSGKYTYADKFYGRSLNESGFSRALREFVHDGVSLRLDVVPRVVEKIRELRSCIQQLESYRFYSSSLLILFDERRCCSDGACEQNCKSYQQIQKKEQWQFQQRDGANEVKSTGSGTLTAESSSGDSSRHVNDKEESCLRRVHADCLCACARVDVRMIDFAHTTFRGFLNDEITHEGADHGYLRGLDTLINEFESIINNATAQNASSRDGSCHSRSNAANESKQL